MQLDTDPRNVEPKWFPEGITTPAGWNFDGHDIGWSDRMIPYEPE